MPTAKTTGTMALWNSVCKTNPKDTKAVSIGTRHFTAIDAYTQIRMATEQFGPVGVGWGWYDVTHAVFEGVLLTSIKLWHGSRDNFFEAIGCTRLTNKSGADLDAGKKGLTDALTKGLSYLGFNADVFLGLFDDNKYVAEACMEAQQQAPAPAPPPAPAPAPPPSSNELATREQVAGLRAIIERTGSDVEALLAYYSKLRGIAIDDVGLLTRAEVLTAAETLRRKEAQQKSAESETLVDA